MYKNVAKLNTPDQEIFKMVNKLSANHKNTFINFEHPLFQPCTQPLPSAEREGRAWV